MHFIKSIILIVVSLLAILFSVLAFQKLYSLQQSLYTLQPSDIANFPDIIGKNFQAVYLFVSITLIIAVLAFIYFAFIDISKEFKLAIETKRAKEEEIVKEDIDLGELEEEITESDIERKKREKLNFLKSKIRKAYNDKNKSKTEICEEILSIIGKEIEIVQGEIFLLKTENNNDFSFFELIATYAYYIPKEQKVEFEYGEGLVGQVAKGQEHLYIGNVPEDYIKVASGLGKAVPNRLLILPILKDKVTIGIMELASFKEIQEPEIELLISINEEIGDLFGSNIMDIVSKIIKQKNLDKTEELAEENQEISIEKMQEQLDSKTEVVSKSNNKEDNDDLDNKERDKDKENSN